MVVDLPKRPSPELVDTVGQWMASALLAPGLSPGNTRR
jgi:hypothetical protein